MMMLPEMTSSARVARVARAFQRLARGAVVGLALGGLAACGGGGSSKPGTPEMTITPPAPTAEDIASATDITGQDTIEGRLDSDNRRVFYKIRIDEPTMLALRLSSEDGIDVTVYDSAGNVVNPSTATEQAAVASRTAAVAGMPLVWYLGFGGAGTALKAAGAKLGTYGIAFAPHAVGAVAAGVAIAYTVQVGKAAAALRQIRRPDIEVEFDAESEKEVSIEDHFDGESLARTAWTFTPTVSIGKFGTLRLVTVEGKAAVRISHTRSEQCPAGIERTFEAKYEPKATWGQSVPIAGEILNRLINKTFEGTITFREAKAPRRKEDRPHEIAVTVQRGGSETVVLTDEIEDPQGGALTFAVSAVPDGWGVTSDGPRGSRLTIAAREVATGGTFTVTATDPARDCWNFPVRVSIEGEDEEEEPGTGTPTPPSGGGGAVYACMTSETAGVRLCSGVVSPTHGCLEGSTRLASCPTTGPGAVFSCGGRFTYLPSGPGANFVIEGARSACNEEFTVHKPS